MAVFDATASSVWREAARGETLDATAPRRQALVTPRTVVPEETILRILLGYVIALD